MGYDVVTQGDFDGDLHTDLLIRDSSNGGSFYLPVQVDKENKFLVGQQLLDGFRYDSLTSKLDTFIKKESDNSRNLRSMFLDFSIANYVNSLDFFFQIFQEMFINTPMS